MPAAARSAPRSGSPSPFTPARGTARPRVHLLRRTSPWALLVDIGALDGSARGLDAKTARLVVARLTDAGLLGAEHTLLRLEDVVLLLERPLVLRRVARRAERGSSERALLVWAQHDARVACGAAAAKEGCAANTLAADRRRAAWDRLEAELSYCAESNSLWAERLWPPPAACGPFFGWMKRNHRQGRAHRRAACTCSTVAATAAVDMTRKKRSCDTRMASR